ncbi:MAG: P1 family peptidase [Candidatus Puniceispirillaceae bacterium]
MRAGQTAGPRNLITDVAGVRVGNAHDDSLKSGVTVLAADRPFTASVHVMGGAPGTRETDLLAPDKLVTEIDALVLSGGSALGLDAASGVANALRAAGTGFDVEGQKIPIVPAAILFDLLNGGDKGWVDNPYAGLGAAAWTARGADFDLGSAGAGYGAVAGPVKGGLGSASLVLENGVTVGALVAVNAHGAPSADGVAHLWAAPWELNDEFGGLGPAPAGATTDVTLTRSLTPAQNTTIGIIATDARLDKAQCQRLAVAAHDGFARALVPSHTPFDGDLIFAVSTGARDLDSPVTDAVGLGHAAATAMARAVARGVWEARPAPGDLVPTFRDHHGI